MQPDLEESHSFIEALLRRGWQIQGDEIHSKESYLHFPYPEGWSNKLDDLKELMIRRRTRFEDPDHFQYLGSEDYRDLLILVHTQAIEAIAEATS